jgi:hypothetical protein
MMYHDEDVREHSERILKPNISLMYPKAAYAHKGIVAPHDAHEASLACLLSTVLGYGLCAGYCLPVKLSSG